MSDLADLVGTAFTESIVYARASERILAAIELHGVVVSSVGDVLKLAPDAGPEIEVALTHLAESVEALRRAHGFLAARFDVRFARPGSDT